MKKPTVTIPALGATNLIGNRLDLTDRQESRLLTTEKEIGDLEGLVQCFGYKDYREVLGSGEIKLHTQIRVYHGFVNPDARVVYNFKLYYPQDEDFLARIGGCPEKARAVLSGINWWYVPQVHNE